MSEALPRICEPDAPSGGDAAFAAVLREAVAVTERADLEYLLIGGLASAALGRPRWTHDIDLLVAPEDAPRSLRELERAGFETERTDERWLYKAFKRDVLVDVIFRITNHIYLDAPMERRARRRELMGTHVWVASPEDQIVIKALVHQEQTPRHWHDALGLLLLEDLDWEYLLWRARHGVRRMLSLLVYADSNDSGVPAWAIGSLFEAAYSRDAPVTVDGRDAGDRLG